VGDEKFQEKRELDIVYTRIASVKRALSTDGWEKKNSYKRLISRGGGPAAVKLRGMIAKTRGQCNSIPAEKEALKSFQKKKGRIEGKKKDSKLPYRYKEIKKGKIRLSNVPARKVDFS